MKELMAMRHKTTYLVFDTETTDLPLKGVSEKDPRQPHLVQLAGQLVDARGDVLAGINFPVRLPEGAEMGKKAEAVHGLSKKHLDKFGVPLEWALGAFGLLVRRAHGLVAHNAKFDLSILSFAYHRAGLPNPLTEMSCVCTMEASKKLLRLPPRGGFGGYKNPSLNELHLHAFDRVVKGAHDAMVDVVACRDCFFWLMEEK